MILLTCLVFGTSLAFAKIGDQQVNEGVTLEVPLSAYDPDGDNLSFSLSNNPSFVSLIDNGDGTGLLIISPDFDDAGTYTQVRITVTDDGSPPLSAYEEITITVNDVSLTYTITATAGPGGSIAPSGAVTVNHGANQTFTITPDPGYHIADVLVDGSSVGAVPTYTFTNVTADHTIEAIFAPDKTELKCYNNVFNPLKGEKAIIEVSLEEPGMVSIVVYNAKGKKIKEFPEEEKEAKTHKYYWYGKDETGDVVGSGLYFVHMKAGYYKKTKKIVVIK